MSDENIEKPNLIRFILTSKFFLFSVAIFSLYSLPIIKRFPRAGLIQFFSLVGGSISGIVIVYYLKFNKDWIEIWTDKPKELNT